MTHETDLFGRLTQAPTTVDQARYDSLRTKTLTIRTASIPGPTVRGNHLPVFVVHDFADSTAFDAHCEPLPEPRQTGIRIFGLRLSFSAGGGTGDEIDPVDLSKAALDCLRTLYRFTLEETVHQPEMLLHRHPNNREQGLLVWVPLGGHSGLLRLRIETRTGPDPEDWRLVTEIPFSATRNKPRRLDSLCLRDHVHGRHRPCAIPTLALRGSQARSHCPAHAPEQTLAAALGRARFAPGRGRTAS